MVLKEFTQLKRDRLTFAMIVGIPIMQTALFGYAINTNPKHLDTAIISADDTDITRSFIAALENSSYFNVVATLPNEAAGREALAQGKVLFVINIPAGFTRQLLRHERPVAVDRSRRHQSHGYRERIGRGERHCAVGHRKRDHRTPRQSSRRPRTVRCDDSPALQPRQHYAVLRGAGPDGHGAHAHHGFDDWPRHHARARARHHGKPAGHAGRRR